MFRTLRTILFVTALDLGLLSTSAWALPSYCFHEVKWGQRINITASSGVGTEQVCFFPGSVNSAATLEIHILDWSGHYQSPSGPPDPFAATPPIITVYVYWAADPNSPRWQYIGPSTSTGGLGLQTFPLYLLKGVYVRVIAS